MQQVGIECLLQAINNTVHKKQFLSARVLRLVKHLLSPEVPLSYVYHYGLVLSIQKRHLNVIIQCTVFSVSIFFLFFLELLLIRED